jgi:hypothetical protein
VAFAPLQRRCDRRVWKLIARIALADFLSGLQLVSRKKFLRAHASSAFAL